MMFSLRALLWFFLLVAVYARLWRFEMVGDTILIFLIPAVLLEVIGLPMFSGGSAIPALTLWGWSITAVFTIVVFWLAAWGMANLIHRFRGKL